MEMKFFHDNWRAIKKSKEYKETLDRIMRGEMPHARQTFEDAISALDDLPK